MKLLALILLTSTALSQSTPPACPNLKPASHPTSEQLRQTAEANAADPTVLLAAEPIENFGVQRFRLEDYADCTGTVGCYWSDLDAQATRAEAALKTAIQTRKPHERLALVLDIDETSLSSYCEMRHEDYGYIRPMFES